MVPKYVLGDFTIEVEHEAAGFPKSYKDIGDQTRKMLTGVKTVRIFSDGHRFRFPYDFDKIVPLPVDESGNEYVECIEETTQQVVHIIFPNTP